MPVEPLVGSACTTTVSPSADLEDLIDSASGGDVICLQAGNYGSLTIDSARNSYVTVRSVIAHVAVFDSITLDDASFIRLEQLTVHGSISNGLDNTNNIQVVANDVEGVWVDAPSTNGAGPGPASWTIEFNDIHDCSDFCVALVSDDPEDYWPVTDITIRGNRIGPMDGGEDAIRIHNWQDVVIEDNEITGVIEDSQHNDCLQSVSGGDRLAFAKAVPARRRLQNISSSRSRTAWNIVSTTTCGCRATREGSAPVVGQVSKLWSDLSIIDDTL